MSKYFARRQLRNAIQASQGSDVSTIHRAEIGGRVLVYRSKSGLREVSFPALDVSGNDTTVL